MHFPEVVYGCSVLSDAGHENEVKDVSDVGGNRLYHDNAPPFLKLTADFLGRRAASGYQGSRV
jgi:hypothetical protein